MKKKFDSDIVIEELVDAVMGSEELRERHIFRENLRSLVRLAKSEQVAEIKANVRRLAGVLESHSARRRAKALLMAQRLPDLLDQVQQQFEFKQ